jgi:hypothetical protein
MIAAGLALILVSRRHIKYPSTSYGVHHIVVAGKRSSRGPIED